MTKRQAKSRALIGFAIAFGFAFLPPEVRAASLFGQVSQGASIISDAGGVAELAPGESAIVSIFLSLDAEESVSVFEGVFDLGALNWIVTSDTASVISDGWATVAENTAAGQSSWSDLSSPSPLVGDRLVAQWLVDGSGSAPGNSLDVLLAIGANTFAAVTIAVDPFFELIPITTPQGALLVQIVVVPEPGTATLLGLGLVVFGLNGRRRGRKSGSVFFPSRS